MNLGELRLDSTRCDGHAICVLTCPELIRLDTWGYATIPDGSIDSARVARRARRAVSRCPAGALSVAPARHDPGEPG